MRIAVRFATLLLALPALVGALCETVSVASAETAAPAGARSPYGFTQREFDELADRASKAVGRCDGPEGRRLIGLMRRNAESLRTAAATPLGTPQMLQDALRLFEVARSFEQELRRCDQPHMAPSIDAGESYGFYTKPAAEALEGYMKDAAAAAKNCREDLYDKAIADLRGFADALDRTAGQNVEQNRKDAANLRRAANDLADAQTRAARFAHCRKDQRTTAPETTPGGAGQRELPPGPAEPRTLAPPREVGAVPPPLDGNIFMAQLITLYSAYSFYVEPSLGLGPSRFGADSPSYSSTGSQAPFAADGSGRSTADICGELAFWYVLFVTADRPSAAALFIANPQLGLALNLCSKFGSETTLFDIARHGNGRVLFQLRETRAFMLLVQARIVLWLQLDALSRNRIATHPRQHASAENLAQNALAPGGRWWPIMLTAGLGPSFVRTKLTLTSDQSFFGGGVPSTTETRTETGLAFRIGASTAVCTRCIFGHPLVAGVEGTFTWLPSREISLRSPAFGFTETARLGSRTNTSVIFKVSVPIGLGRF